MKLYIQEWPNMTASRLPRLNGNRVAVVLVPAGVFAPAILYNLFSSLMRNNTVFFPARVLLRYAGARYIGASGDTPGCNNSGVFSYLE